MRREEGFSLLEVLVAISILAVGILVVVGGISQSHSIQARNTDLRLATSLAEGKLAEIVARSPLLVHRERGEFPDQPGFSWTSSLEPYEMALPDGSTARGLYRARVTVHWTRQGKPRTLDLGQLVADR